MQTPDWGGALDAWRAALGDTFVSTDEEVRHAAERATFQTTARVLAVLRPADRAQVQACVRIAHDHGVVLHPTSGGKNWGYGSRVPDRDAALLDLARLDRIVDFDEQLAYVTVEPGVTFRALSQFLRDTRASVFASVTGGPADGSVIANALERGDGSGPLGDRFAHVCGLEVVTPDGECIHTGFARFPDSRVAPLGRWGAGPSLDGLFSQSRLGIVTRMTIWLTPYPAAFRLARITLDDDTRLPGLVDALRSLRLRNITPATIPLWNDLKALTLVTRYPWDRTQGATPLPDAVRQALRREYGLGAWTATLSLYGESAAHAAALTDLVTAAIRPHARIELAEGPTSPLDAAAELCGPGLGIPHDHNTPSVYWRMRGAVGTDPDRDGCGFQWLSHAVPFTGSDVRRAIDIAAPRVTAHGFEPGVAVLGISARLIYLLVSLAYDRTLDGEDARASACHDAVFDALVAAGYPPFRTGVQSHARVPSNDAGSTRYLELLRRSLDPRGVLG